MHGKLQPKDDHTKPGTNEFRHTPFEKPMDKPAKQYTSNETVPMDSFNAEPVDENFENPGDLSKRFM